MSDPAVPRDCLPAAQAKAVPDEIAIEIGKEIDQALERIPPDHRVGFLFGMVIRKLDDQGLNERQVLEEVLTGLTLAYDTMLPSESSKIPTESG
jgi:hypothetical protein